MTFSNFVARKVRFLNKPAKVLFKEIELSILSYTLIQEGLPTNDEVEGIYLSFEDDATKYAKMEHGLIANVLLIKFKNMMDSKSVLAVVRENNLKWNSETTVFFNNFIIKEIQVLKN